MSEGLTFGQWLRREREARSLTQEQLADSAEIRRSYLNRIENDHVTRPTLELRQRIHAALGTSEDELIALGIVRARGARPEPLQAVREHSEDDDFFASLSPRQKQMLRRLLDRADRPRPGDEDATDDAQPRREAKP